MLTLRVKTAAHVSKYPEGESNVHVRLASLEHTVKHVHFNVS